MNWRIGIWRRNLSLVVGACAIAAGWGGSGWAMGQSLPEARIVLFTPSDVEADEDPHMLADVTWETVKADIREAVRAAL